MSRDHTYGLLDRLVHRVAFSHPAVQLTAADMEDSWYGKRVSEASIERPVFITSLPRAGTTLLLEALSQLDDVATHCYRDMPFVLAPILWEKLSGGFRRPASPAERAHGDGMQVGYDSPEAFEEVVWKTFWPDKYRSDRIQLWSPGDQAEGFSEFFASHLKRVIAARSASGSGPRRYVSKNNANIARIAYLRKLVPGSLLLVPFRRPVDQASSLLRQHLRFSSLHAEDPFSKRYMADIGHLEFGQLHTPIEFTGLNEILEKYRPDTLDYWIAYWTLAFEHVYRVRHDVLLLSYERACADGERTMSTIADCLGLGRGALAGPAALFRSPVQYGSGDTADGPLVERAESLYRALLDSSIL